jgi:hypothetical protein
VTQAGVSQCRHERGKCTVLGRRAVADLVAVHAVEPDAVGLAAVRSKSVSGAGECRRCSIPCSDRAGVTADADVEIDDQAELFARLPGVGSVGHARFRREPAP